MDGPLVSPAARADAALRWSRAAVLGAVALGSGALAHVSAAGRMPGAVALVVLYAVATAGSAALLARPASTRRVVLLVMGAQTFVHGALTALSGHRGDPPLRTATAPAPPVPVTPVPTGGSRSGSYFDLAYAGAHPTAAGGPVLPAPVQHLLADLTGPHASMALAHLAAAVVVGLWLASGERALWAVLGLLARGVRDLVGRATLLGGYAGVPHARSPHPDHATVPRPRTVLAAVPLRRGPPAFAAG